MGRNDKMIRLGAAALIAILFFMNLISGTVAIILGVIAIIFASTSFINFCPIYAAFAINTKERNN